eukprot:SAG31_NODE_2218_length_6159_cov_3.265182_3_plen_88_part_00
MDRLYCFPVSSAGQIIVFSCVQRWTQENTTIGHMHLVARRRLTLTGRPAAQEQPLEFWLSDGPSRRHFSKLQSLAREIDAEKPLAVS